MVSAYLRRTTRKYTQAPARTQANLLRNLLHRASKTEWGLRYGFAEIAQSANPVATYQTRLPLHTYTDLEGDVVRIREGATNVLWPGPIRHFAVSSGTTSVGKIIPVSGDMLRQNRRFSVDITLDYLLSTGNARLLMGKHLALPGRIEDDAAFPGTKIGEISGLQALYPPNLYRLLLQALPNDIAFAPNWDQKLKMIVDKTIDMDIRLVAMAPTWAIVLFSLLVERHNELYNSGVTTVGEIWPNLQLYISGGVALSSYKSIINEQIGLSGLHYVEVYGASEGFFSFQSDLEDPAMLLHLKNGVFFEFVRMDELHNGNPTRYTIDEISCGVRYAPILTTCSGLWSYVLGDVVRFTQTSPHKIVVAGRTSEMIDKYGEAVFGEDARMAIDQACNKTQAQVQEYHVTALPPTSDRIPALEWLLEFDRLPKDPKAFLDTLDKHLCDINRHYEIRREARAFAPPEIVILPSGTFYRWLKSTRKDIGGQTKMPRMSEDREIAQGILELAGADAQRIQLNS